MAKKVTLKDGHTGEVEYPLTITEQVVDKSGKTVDRVIDDKFEGIKADNDKRFANMQATINAKQLEIGAVQTDELPTEGSGNFVNSGGVYEALHNEQFVDDEPMAGSNKLVKSGAVFEALLYANNEVTDNAELNKIVLELYGEIPDDSRLRWYARDNAQALEIWVGDICILRGTSTGENYVVLTQYQNSGYSNVEAVLCYDNVYKDDKGVKNGNIINIAPKKNILFQKLLLINKIKEELSNQTSTNDTKLNEVITTIAPLVHPKLEFTIKGKYYSTNGNLNSNADWESTELLDIKSNTVAELSIKIRQGANAVSYFDDNENYISGVTFSESTENILNELEIPYNASYYAFSQATQDYKNYILLSSDYEEIKKMILENKDAIDSYRQLLYKVDNIDKLFVRNEGRTENSLGVSQLEMALTNRKYINGDNLFGKTIKKITINAIEHGIATYGRTTLDNNYEILGTLEVDAGTHIYDVVVDIRDNEYLYFEIKNSFKFLSYGQNVGSTCYFILGNGTLETWPNACLSFNVEWEEYKFFLQDVPDEIASLNNSVEKISANISTKANILNLIQSSAKKKEKSINWLAIGDSFTELNDKKTSYFNEGYLTRTCNKIPELDYTNMGHSGLTFGNTKNNETYPLVKSDVYTILFGQNDWDQNIALGTKDDFDKMEYNGTILGNFGGLIARLVEIDKEAINKIIVMTPTKRGFYCNRSTKVIDFNGKSNNHASFHSSLTPNENGTYLKDIADGIVVCCKSKGIKYVDLYNESFFSEKNAVNAGNVIVEEEQKNVAYPEFLEKLSDGETLPNTLYDNSCIGLTYDGLHPSDAGAEIISLLLAPAIKEIVFS